MASEGACDSYEALTAASMLVDKRDRGRDAAPMQLAALLALSWPWGLLIVVGIVFVFGITAVAIWKMRKDEFWEEPPG
jgi:hypothetical protein